MKSGKSLLMAVVLLGLALVPAYAAIPNTAVIFHDAYMTYTDVPATVGQESRPPFKTYLVGIYDQDVTPWMDVLVQLEDGKWYGPERNEDGITAQPLPEGYHWEFSNGFAGTPNGEMWWKGSELDVDGEATLFDADGNVVIAVPVRIELHIPGTSSGGAVEKPY